MSTKHTLWAAVLLLAALQLRGGSPPRIDLPLPSVDRLTATGYDSHVELQWPAVRNGSSYAVYRLAGDSAVKCGTTSNCYYLDFVATPPRDTVYTYRVFALDQKGSIIRRMPTASASLRPFDDKQLMQMVARYTLRYFWEYADPTTGLTLERSNSTRVHCVTTGGSGFGIMGLLCGVANGWISRDNAVDRMLKITAALDRLPRFHGAWAHWYNGLTGEPYSFGPQDDGGDLVETAFLVEGLLAAHEYFDAEDRNEALLRTRIDSLWRGVEWDFYTQASDTLYWHWSPTYGFGMNHPIRGYDETMIVYVLGASSPTHPIGLSVYENCWVNRREGEFFCATDFYGIMLPLGKRLLMGGPMFWIHYSFLGLDPRGLSDRYADYGEQNRRYTLVDRAYCIDNPYRWTGYGADLWGLTACDALPSGYQAHSPGVGHDFGTIAPTAALGSMPYTPRESMAVLRNLYRNLGAVSFGIMGFYDAINLSLGEPLSTQSYIAIDQGPILVMIENHRHATVWNAFMRHMDVRRGLNALGFKIYHKSIQPKS